MTVWDIETATATFEKTYSPQRDATYIAICKLYEANRLYFESPILLYDRVRKIQAALVALVGPDWLEKEKSFQLPLQETPKDL